MKKYLMTGVAALAFAATFTSCSKTDLYDENKVEQEKEATVNEKYAAAFEKAFGKVGANVDWGFSSVASTRGTRAAECDKDAHMWVDKGYDVPVELSAAQKERVIAYFQHNKLTAGGSKDWTEFFIQQVYKGGTSPIGNKTTPNGFSPEEYHAANGGWITGGSQMDYLTSNGDDHIFDFNSGDCSEIGNVQNNPGVNYLNDNGNNTHKDKIRLMKGSLASNFGYHNSAADKTYNNQYVMVDGSVIDTWAKDFGNNIGAKVSGRYFVGFDFEQFFKDEDVYTGSWQFKGETYKYVQNAPNKYCGYIESFNDTNKPTALGDAEIQKWLDAGYLPVSGNDKQWAKVIRCADGYFSDWIVCIAPGHAIKPLYRVIAEDLSAESAGDFDFNDVVFDIVKYNQSTNTTTLKLIACGGTLPLTVGGVEVHSVYGQNAPNANGKYDMYNTSAVGGKTHDPEEFTVSGKFTTPEEILSLKIIVTKDGSEYELKATKGVAACKILVDDRFPIVTERTSIANAQGNFTTYVQGNWNTAEFGNFWWVQE